MLEKLHSRKKLQLFMGFMIGFCFGFLLQRGGVTRYDYIIRQLLLTDWTVMKIILSAIVTGMIGIYFLKSKGLVQLHKKSGSFGATVIGALIFGVGFAILGYCPGTMAGAVGQGSLDALFGGIVGMLAGAGIYAALYERLHQSLLKMGEFGEISFPQLLGWKTWSTVVLFASIIVCCLVFIEIFF